MVKILADIDMSLDGFVAGPDISPEQPLGVGGERLIWYGDDVNDPDGDPEVAYGGVDGRVLREAMESEGAVIMGRRTFEVSIDAWGDEPPIHKPCFVLTSRPAPPLEMAGGTSFTFVTGGADEAIRQASAAAGSRGVGVMGGAQTIRSFLEEGLLDALHLHIVPVVLGGGLRLFEPGAGGPIHFEKVRALDGERAVHLLLRRTRSPSEPGARHG
jgi:dihydrofolate reductase